MKKILTTAAIIAGLYLNPIQAQDICKVNSDSLVKQDSILVDEIKKSTNEDKIYKNVDKIIAEHQSNINCYLTKSLETGQTHGKFSYLFFASTYYKLFAKPSMDKIVDILESKKSGKIYEVKYILLRYDDMFRSSDIAIEEYLKLDIK